MQVLGRHSKFMFRTISRYKNTLLKYDLNVSRLTKTSSASRHHRQVLTSERAAPTQRLLLWRQTL